jgi:hypothetical protein
LSEEELLQFIHEIFSMNGENLPTLFDKEIAAYLGVDHKKQISKG